MVTRKTDEITLKQNIQHIQLIYEFFGDSDPYIGSTSFICFGHSSVINTR